MKIIRVLTAAVLLAVAGNVYAAPATSTFQVTTTAFSPTTCGITAGDLNFSAYNPAASVTTDATAIISVACTNAGAYTVYPNSGINVLGAQGRMLNQTGTGYVNYDMYTDLARINKWSSTNKISGTGTGINNYTDYTIYGRVASAQGAADGSQDGTYSDLVTVTVEF